MSTDTRRGRSRARRKRAFLLSFLAVVGVLAVVGGGAAALGVVQGPRVTDVQVDPDAAVAASGSRLIVTTSQSLAEVDAAQVTVEPETPFAVDTSGRSVGVRFAQPLHDDTEYTVTIDGVRGLGGGPDAAITETFRTPAIDVHLAQRGGQSDDTIFRTDLTGDSAVPVFTHPRIQDFRATATQLVVSVRTDDDRAALIATDLDGGNERELELPGADGIVTTLQAADRGDLIGFTYSDAAVDASGGLESALFTISGDELTRIEVTGTDARIAEWRFVPDTDSILLLTFDGSLLLTGASGGDAVSLGTAISIDGVSGTDAVIERLDGKVVVDLTDGTEQPLVAPDIELGLLDTALPLPGGATLRSSVVLDETGTRSLGTSIAFVDADGAAREIAEVGPTDALLQTCVSPSGRYAAVLVAPDAVDNPYDTYPLPLPERLETRIVQIEDAAEIVPLEGFGVSWCRVPIQ